MTTIFLHTWYSYNSTKVLFGRAGKKYGLKHCVQYIRVAINNKCQAVTVRNVLKYRRLMVTNHVSLHPVLDCFNRCLLLKACLCTQNKPQLIFKG